MVGFSVRCLDQLGYSSFWHRMLELNQPGEVLETCPTPCLHPVYCTPTKIQTWIKHLRRMLHCSVMLWRQIKDDEQLYQESRPQTSHTIRELGCYINTIKIEYLSLVCTLANTSPCPLFYASYHLLYLRRDSNSHLVIRSHGFYSVELRRYK